MSCNLSPQAIAHYEQAGDYYKGEESTRSDSLPLNAVVIIVKVWTAKVVFFFLFSSANKCFLKVATYAAQLEQYQKAVEIFEQV